MTSVIVQTPAIVIRRVAVAPMDNNVYLLTSPATGQQILIDAANDPAAIRRLLAEAATDGPTPKLAAIVTTHQHFDHIQALAPITSEFGAPTFAGRDDAAAITEQTGVAIDHLMDDSDEIAVPGITLKVIGIRGHTPGSIVLAYAEANEPTHLLVGDDLFPGGIGNTWGDQAAFASLLNDVITRLVEAYPDDTVVWPGHGAPTTIGAERPHLAQWRARGW